MPRAAIIGAGPAGFYAAEHLLREDFAVDLFDRLPTPYGLVRAGVAPDHPKIKTVTRVYDRTAERPNFRYIGGVEFGRDVSRDELLDHYHAVVYTIGTAEDRRLGVPGEDLRGSHAATEFVAWYNGHPHFADRSFDLGHERAVVVGNGNVALDCARMLVLAADELAATDTADHALDAFGAAGIREVVVLGRRGPAEAAFTNPELRELGELSQADVVVDPAALESVDEPDDPTRRRNVEILRGYAARRPSGKSYRIVLRFLSSPVEVLGDDSVAGIRVVRNRLVDGRAVAGDDEQVIPCGLVLRAVGYRGVAVPGLPFDDARGVIANVDGRVTGAPGEYVAGWIKRGPSGVIGTNKKCAAGTVAKLLEDRAAGRLNTPASDEDITEHLRERLPAVVDWSGWQAIDEAERRAGEPAGRPRVKFVRVDDMHEAAAPARRS